VSARSSTKCLATEPGAPTSGEMRDAAVRVVVPSGMPVAGRRDRHLVGISTRICDVQNVRVHQRCSPIQRGPRVPRESKEGRRGIRLCGVYELSASWSAAGPGDWSPTVSAAPRRPSSPSPPCSSSSPSPSSSLTSSPAGPAGPPDASTQPKPSAANRRSSPTQHTDWHLQPPRAVPLNSARDTTRTERHVAWPLQVAQPGDRAAFRRTFEGVLPACNAEDAHALARAECPRHSS
jgi:hypothetical protein